jgi:hypothetical protein
VIWLSQSLEISTCLISNLKMLSRVAFALNAVPHAKDEAELHHVMVGKHQETRGQLHMLYLLTPLFDRKV